MLRSCLRRELADQGFKNRPSVLTSENGLAGPLGMGHHAHDVSVFIANARNIAGGAVRIRLRTNVASCVTIPEYNPVFRLETFEQSRGSEVIAFHMGDGELECSPFQPSAHGRVFRFRSNVNILADELKGPVADHCSGKKTHLQKDLKAVANPKDPSAFGGESGYTAHDGRETGERARAQVVTIRKSTRQDDAIQIFDVRLFMPNESSFLIQDVLEGVITVVIAVGTGKRDDTKLH